MPRLLHLADLHLGWQPRQIDAERARARRERRDALLAAAVDVALSERVDAVVIAGDLFETFEPEGATVEGALRELGRLAEAGIPSVTVPGNHDELTYAASVYRRYADRWPGVLVTAPMPEHVVTLALDGVDVHVYGLAYVGGVTDVKRATAALPRAGGDGVHVFVAHGTLSGASGAAGERSLPLDRARLASAGYDYVALGHIHVPGRYQLGRGVAVYPGCVGGKGLDDVGSPAWTLVELRAGEAPRVDELPAAVQPLHVLRLDLGAFADGDEVAEAVGAHGDPDALVRVELTGALPFPLDVAALQERLAPAFFHLELRDATTEVSEALLDAWMAGRSVGGAFVRRLRSRMAETDDEVERARVRRALLFGIDALTEAS